MKKQLSVRFKWITNYCNQKPRRAVSLANNQRGQRGTRGRLPMLNGHACTLSDKG